MVINSNSRGLYYPLQTNWNDELSPIWLLSTLARMKSLGIHRDFLRWWATGVLHHRNEAHGSCRFHETILRRWASIPKECILADTPPKNNMEPENTSLEKETHKPKPPIFGFQPFPVVYSIVLQTMILENCLKLLRRNSCLHFFGGVMYPSLHGFLEYVMLFTSFGSRRWLIDLWKVIPWWMPTCGSFEVQADRTWRRMGLSM